MDTEIKRNPVSIKTNEQSEAKDQAAIFKEIFDESVKDAEEKSSSRSKWKQFGSVVGAAFGKFGRFVATKASHAGEDFRAAYNAFRLSRAERHEAEHISQYTEYLTSRGYNVTQNEDAFSVIKPETVSRAEPQAEQAVEPIRTSQQDKVRMSQAEDAASAASGIVDKEAMEQSRREHWASVSAEERETAKTQIAERIMMWKDVLDAINWADEKVRSAGKEASVEKDEKVKSGKPAAEKFAAEEVANDDKPQPKTVKPEAAQTGDRPEVNKPAAETKTNDKSYIGNSAEHRAIRGAEIFASGLMPQLDEYIKLRSDPNAAHDKVLEASQAIMKSLIEAGKTANALSKNNGQANKTLLAMEENLRNKANAFGPKTGFSKQASREADAELAFNAEAEISVDTLGL